MDESKLRFKSRRVGCGTRGLRLVGARAGYAVAYFPVPPASHVLPSDLLRRLCVARDALREVEEDRRAIPEIARAAGISRYHFVRVYRSVFGETPQQCRTAAQLEHARFLLALTERPVTEICCAVGFSSLGSFSARFARKFGVAPSVFRRRCGGAASAPAARLQVIAPGCLSLMGMISAQDRKFGEAAVAGS